jgi:hypothetical protein
MSDIVERLRLDAEPTEGDMETAAQEIEKLRAALHKLRVEYFELSSKKADEIERLRAWVNKMLQENRDMEKKIEKAAAIIINARAALGEKE